MNRVCCGAVNSSWTFPHGSGGSHGDNQPLSVGEPNNAAAQTGAGTSFGANGDHHTRAVELPTYFCVLTIRKHLLKIRFERSGRGQEPSRGHKFSILENVVFHRDFTSATLVS